MSKVFKGLALLIIFVLQSTLLSFIEIKGVKPDILLIVIVIFSVFGGSLEGSIYGLIGGILQDIFFGHAVGFNMLIYMLIGFIFGEISKNLFKEKFVTVMSMVVLATFIKHVIYILLMVIMDSLVPLSPLIFAILIEAFYNAIISYIIFYFIIKYKKKRNI